jgi:hypothetical protein
MIYRGKDWKQTLSMNLSEICYFFFPSMRPKFEDRNDDPTVQHFLRLKEEGKIRRRANKEQLKEQQKKWQEVLKSRTDLPSNMPMPPCLGDKPTKYIY